MHSDSDDSSSVRPRGLLRCLRSSRVRAVGCGVRLIYGLCVLNPKYVSPSYQHVDKVLTVAAPLAVSGVRLKWYDLARADLPVPRAIHDLARAHLSEVELGLDGELGFVILHRCGQEFYFLIVNTWRGNNELWETVFYKENDVTPKFSLFPRDSIHKPTYCVWELGAILHEKRSWEEFLRSTRGEDAEQHYLRDTCSGIA